MCIGGGDAFLRLTGPKGYIVEVDAVNFGAGVNDGSEFAVAYHDGFFKELGRTVVPQPQRGGL